MLFPRDRHTAVVISLLAGGLALTGCSPVVDVEPAANAANPECAEIMVALPDLVAGEEQRETNSQATSAWGDPSLVVLRCGVPEPGPTTDKCVGVNGVDWVIEEGKGAWTMTTYGREPATEILIDPDKVASSTVLVDLGAAVSQIPQDEECVNAGDVNLPEGG
ncbi:DUF3515 domain-containing protein [Arthrobacter monumenti]